MRLWVLDIASQFWMQGLGLPDPPMSLRLELGCLDGAWVQVLGIYRNEGQGLARAVNYDHVGSCSFPKLP